MPRTPARFTQSELTKAAKAMQAAGLRVTGARIDRDGKIEILCAEAQQQQDQAPAVPRSLADWKRQKHGQG